LLVYVVQFHYLNARLIEPSGEGRWVRNSDAAKIRVVAGNFMRGRQAEGQSGQRLGRMTGQTWIGRRRIEWRRFLSHIAWL